MNIVRAYRLSNGDEIEVAVSIDLEEIAKEAAVRAAHNRSGKSILLDGAVKGKLLKRSGTAPDT